jgi:iron complex outermembrane recepter protein
MPFIFAPANGSTFGAFGPTTCDGTQLQTRDQEDFSAEVRFSGDYGNVDWSAGVYYLNIKREVGISLGADLGFGVLTSLYNAPGTNNPTSQLFWDRFDTNVYAAFGNVPLETRTSSFTLGLAMRYDIEDRSVENLVPVVTDPITGGPINPGQAFGPIRSPVAGVRAAAAQDLAALRCLRRDQPLRKLGRRLQVGRLQQPGLGCHRRPEFRPVHRRRCHHPRPV